MNSAIYGPATGRVLASGLVVGVWMMLSVSVTGAETTSSPGDMTSATAPERIHLAQAEAEPVESPVSYTADQADRGKERYEKECLDCHGSDLKGGLNGGAPLRGVNFEQKFAEGAPASSLFLFMSNLMPPNSPGRYSESTYADLMAYILKRNGFQPGAPLPSDVDALDYVMMVK